MYVGCSTLVLMHIMDWTISPGYQCNQIPWRDPPLTLARDDYLAFHCGYRFSTVRLLPRSSMRADFVKNVFKKIKTTGEDFLTFMDHTNVLIRLPEAWAAALTVRMQVSFLKISGEWPVSEAFMAPGQSSAKTTLLPPWTCTWPSKSRYWVWGWS